MADRDREFREFFDAEFRPLRRVAFLLTGDWSEAEDLAQEAMVRVYRSWGRINEKHGAYARAVLVNRHRSLLRRARVEARHAIARQPSQLVAEAPGDDHVLVWGALSTLPAREREALVLRYYEDMPQQEIARILRIPVGTVKSLTHRALGRLRAHLDSDVAALVTVSDE